MNNRQAKKLRKAARKMTKGMVVTDYITNPNTNANQLVENCTRSVYQKLKKEFKQHR